VVPEGVKRIIEVDLSRNLELDAKVSPRVGRSSSTPCTPSRSAPARADGCERAHPVHAPVHDPDDAKLAAVANVTQALEAGALTELPATRFALADTAAAHDAVERGAVGKVLIDVRAPDQP